MSIRVFNTATSVDRKQLSHIFDRFYRMEQSRNSETGGYGIGLSIAKAVAEAHKGKITVSSEDGKSLTFHVIL
ncbi:MAG: sensor histidine kinase [Blautia sp.]